jgi:hypothetical protein
MKGKAKASVEDRGHATCTHCVPIFRLSRSLFRLHFHRKGKTSKSLPF